MNCPHCHAPNADDARFCGTCGRATSATEPASNPNLGEAPQMIGREIAGRYRILSKLGEGGMGAVYKAEQMSLKRTVAVKLLRPEVASSAMLLRRFNAEAEAVAKLSHPNTVNIYDFGQDSDGTVFIAMELIEGSSLRSVIHRDAPLPLRRALTIASQVASSLSDAHARSIIHRDLKPDNVMLQERGKQRDVVRVLDFGIAKLRDENRQSQLAMTQAGDMLGTPQYMAPEQIRAEHIDGRTDVYALGCMIYEMVTARLPFEAPTVMALLSKHLLESVIPPTRRRADLYIPPALDALVLGAMAKDPAARPPTMDAFGEQIAALLATLPADTGVATAQQPAVGGAQVPTPMAYSAIPAGPSGIGVMPPPHVPPPQAPPPPYAAPPPSAPPYDPHAHHAPRPPTTPPTTAPSNTLIWVILAILVLGGGGVGLYFALGGKDKPSTTEPDPWAKTGSGGDTVAVAPPAPTQDTPAPPPAVDTWGSPAPTPPVADDTDEPDDPTSGIDLSAIYPGEVKRIMQGLTLKIPAGFTVDTSTSTSFVAKHPSGLAIFAAPLDRAEGNDIDVIAQRYARDTGLELQTMQDLPTGGAPRKLALFMGEMQGMHVTQMATALIGPGYRVAVIVHMPATAVSQGETIQHLGAMLAVGITLPGKTKE